MSSSPLPAYLQAGMEINYMTEITINNRVFRLTDAQLASLNVLLKDAQVRKNYSKEYERNNQEIVSVSVVRWSGECE